MYDMGLINVRFSSGKIIKYTNLSVIPRSNRKYLAFSCHNTSQPMVFLFPIAYWFTTSVPTPIFNKPGTLVSNV